MNKAHTDNFYEIFGCMYEDINGEPTKRTKTTHPYSYDPYVVFRNGKNEEINETAYHDRMIQWDFQKFRDCLNKNGIKGELSIGDPENWNKIEPFLRDYFDDQELKLIILMEGANLANGYPYYVFHTNRKKKI